MQRVRIGLTGLAFVFILVLLATIVARPSDEPTLNAIALEQQVNGQLPAPEINDADPQEPLAELGVAPGNPEANRSGGK
jgi:hypothetical protein